MKRTLTTIQKKASKVLLLAILAGAITSCDSVLNYNEDCDIEYCVKFKYDYNMEEVDVFAEQVRTVSLYAFDENNNLVPYYHGIRFEIDSNEISQLYKNIN